MASRNWSKLIRALLRLAVIVAIVAGAIYWFRFMPVPVVSHTVERGSLIEEVMGTGTLEARVSTTISPKIAGRISVVYADQGDMVSAGDQLVLLEDDELEQQVAIAQANVNAAIAAVERLKIDKERASVILTQAEKNFQRIETLRERDATSQDDLDRASEALGLAMADVSRSEAGINEGQKELISAEKTLEYHDARLRDTIIVAPFDGLVIKRSRESGDVVVPGSPIMTLISTDELWISAWVDETEMAKLHPEQSARIVFRSEPEKNYPATVARLGREADRESREFIVDVRLLEFPTNWAVGQRAEAYVQISQSDDLVLLPAQWIVKRENQAGVFVDVDGVARWRSITVGRRSRDAVEILEGLGEGDILIKSKRPSTELTDRRKVSTL